MEFLYQWDDGDAESYHQLIFTVTASNAVGTSTIGSVNGGSFPIGTNTYAVTVCITTYAWYIFHKTDRPVAIASLQPKLHGSIH